MKKKHALILTAAVLACILIVVLHLQSDPPFGHESVNSPEQYLEVNSFVEKSLKADFAEILPRSIPSNAKAESYCYRYACDLQGDASFYINLTLKYKSATELTAEYERLIKKQPERTIQDGAIEHLFFGADREALNGYFDDEVYDGSVWLFNIVSVDSDKLTIEYTVANISDGGERFDRLSKTLSEMRELIEK